VLTAALLGIFLGAVVCAAQTETNVVPVASAVVADASTKPAVDTPQLKSRTTRYRIEAGDTFDLTFDLSPEFNQTAVAVQPDGFVTSVVLKEFEKPYFVADGQVAKPGKYEMHGNMTVTQAIAIAGGFQSSAKHSQVVLFRRVDDQWTEAKLINVKKMQNDRDLREDPFLHSGDMLFVPKNVLSKIDRLIPNLNAGTYLPLQIP
jgi:polysaccharide export outer membrane protein